MEAFDNRKSYVESYLYRITKVPEYMKCRGKGCNDIVMELFPYCKPCGCLAGVIDLNGKPVTSKTKAKNILKDY